MKKVRIFFAAAALLLVTAGVFAGKSRFTTGPATTLYYLSGTTYEIISLANTGGGANHLNYQTTNTNTVAQFNPSGTDFPIYFYDAVHLAWYSVYYK